MATVLEANVIPPPWGSPLETTDYATLATSWITPAMAKTAMLRRVDSPTGQDVLGQKGSRDCAGILYPYYWPGQSHVTTYRIRRDKPDWKYDKEGNAKADRKYLAPPGGGNHFYIPIGVTAEQLADVNLPIAITEGEKKALALMRLARHDTASQRFIPFALPGVWNWRGTVGKAIGPKGERLDVKGPIIDLDRIEWKDRLAYIVFDSNVHTNNSVQWAQRGFARELATRGAKVELVNLPKDCGVNGIDDLLAARGPARVLDLFKGSVSVSRLQVVQSPQFQLKPDGLFRVTTKGESLSQVRLTNFGASIATNISLDDGVETKREFELVCELMGRQSTFTIPAAEFAGMDWAIQRMGATAIIFPNQRDYARTAIQSLSMTAEERCIYTYTGWRRVEGRWLFLHAGGAIGPEGSESDVNVRLAGSMGRYHLRLPAGLDECTAAVRASVRLVELGPPSISFPLLAATFRSVFGDADFSIHLSGETGAFKSEVAALHQQHFGVDMDRLHLPGSWSSTGNALEVMAFQAKDTVFSIDDFAPQGSSVDVARYHSAADRVFRAAGNHAGRGRLDSNANLRGSKPPRALILSTGEDIPRGQSIRARLLILELSKGDIKSDRLAECQRDARNGLYAEAMGAFVQWVAGRFEEAGASFAQRVAQYRSRAVTDMAHARTPDIVANLQAGFEMFLEFGMSIGALDADDRHLLQERCWKALREAAAAQAKHQAATEPTARYLTLLSSALTSGRAHLQSRNGASPEESPESCGWRRDSMGNWVPRGDCIGWVHRDDLYLDPTAAFGVAQKLGHDVGEILSIAEHTLRKRLREKGRLVSEDPNRGTLTIRRMIGGTSKEVLHLLRSTLLPDASCQTSGDDE